jgi:hypothetical protein
VRARNDRRNYYKLSIGLGAMVDRGSAGKGASADGAVKTGVAAGGIDQYVPPDDVVGGT